jgi:pyruvate dehydrogenase E2 component (dihydrolipoamide acetyltransferase)
MPQLGETVAEGKITKWFVKSGDQVKPGDNLFEIETDKTSMEVPATEAGTLTDIRFEIGQVAKVGAVVAVISGGRSNVTGPAATGAPPKAPIAPPQSPQPLIPAKAGIQKELDPRFRWGERKDSHAYPHMDPFREVRTPERNYGPARLPGGVTVTPLARRLAGERGIELGNINGSGPHGRIVASDVERMLAQSPQAGPGASDVRAIYAGVEYEELPLDSMRATIARRLTEAKQTVPHFYLTSDIDIARLIAMREEANASAPRIREGEAAFKLSFNDFIIKAWAAALQRVPRANAVWAGDRILRLKSSDVGVAVALDEGLITPVIRSAEQKSLTTISREMGDLARRARDKKLKPQEYQGGASAISNLGMYGVREFSAIINPPHSSILAVGSSRRAPIEAEDGSIKFVSQMTVTLSCDHRVIDGALGARLLAAFKDFIESPITALI